MSLSLPHLQSFLDAQPLRSLLHLIDRLLVAQIVDDRPAIERLCAAAPPLLARSTAIVDLLVACALLDDAGANTVGLRARLPRLIAAADREIVSEPHRSVFRYWLRRAGYAPSSTSTAEDVGPTPGDPYFALYHHAHAVFFAADYGVRRAARAEHGARVAACAVLAFSDPPVDPLLVGNADALAELLLAEACLVPPDDALRARVVAALGRLQRDDGSLAMPDGAGDDAIHHAACVAYAACTLVVRSRVFRRARRAADTLSRS